DQLFFCEHPTTGGAVVPSVARSSYGLQPTGFRWQGEVAEPDVYTDAFHASHYVFDASGERLRELREIWRSKAPLSWGEGRDLRLADMEKPHAWAIENIPFLRHLTEEGLISGSHRRNVVYPEREASQVRFRGNGLRPSGAIRFAVTPVSGGEQVLLQRKWKRAWHGAALHNLESIARGGLREGEKGIYLSPSFQYTFCLYSLPDIQVGMERFRLVVEVAVEPGAFKEHGDHYQFCELQHVEPHVPLDCLEWEAGKKEHAVQVV
ncbi:unnamed protein product, partial [Polarella glacialis]